MDAKYIEQIKDKNIPFIPNQITKTANSFESPEPKGILFLILK